MGGLLGVAQGLDCSQIDQVWPVADRTIDRNADRLRSDQIFSDQPLDIEASCGALKDYSTHPRR